MTRCPLCPGVNACLGPDGPEDAEILFIGEAPGKDENRRGRVFIGKTGEEVNSHYLPLASLRRSSVLFTNAIACLPASAGGKLDPTRNADLDLLASCSAHRLHPLIRRGAVRLLVPMGAFACRAICPDVDLELHHGHPTSTAWGIPAFPMYHPALGIHEPKKMLHIRTDWHRLRKYLNGTLQLHTDAYPTPDYQEVTDVQEIEELPLDQPFGFDTESRRSREPHCFTYSIAPGTGRLIRAERDDLLRALQAKLRLWQGPLLVHNWPYDATVVAAMGLTIPTRRLTDTMQLAFHLGNLPQGLKALAYRELGMLMQGFEDLVRPYSSERVLDYYYRMSTLEWPKPEPDLVRADDGKWKVYKPQSLNTKLKRFFTDYSKNPDKDVFKMFEGNWADSQAMIEERCGEYPGMCISHVPFEKTLHYACRDADALVRLYPVLRRMRAQVRKYSQELWREKAS